VILGRLDQRLKTPETASADELLKIDHLETAYSI